MFTPEGCPANKIEKNMLLVMWAQYLRENHLASSKKKMIFAGIGKPTLSLHKYTKDFLVNYWLNHSGEAITYDHPQGNLQARKTMAAAMQSWYQTEINEQNVLFNIGGAGALKAIFSAIMDGSTGCRIVTPFPYYSLYAESSATLHPVDVMQNPKCRLTAESLQEAITSAYELAKLDGIYPKAFLLCDPNNPLGTVLDKIELLAIAAVLRKFPEMVIILDEAYAEMVFVGKHTSLLSVAPDLKKRIILMRSATKGLSAAGERMAITLAFDSCIMSKLVQFNIINCGHSPVSLQLAYAETMAHFKKSDIQTIINFYQPKVEYVQKRLANIGANVPHQNKIEGTFYSLADFSDLIGEPISEATYPAIKTNGIICTDEQIAYSLLFEDFVMISPLSYYGLNAELGLIRLTCSESLNDLKDLLDRLESRLRTARKNKNNKLRLQLEETLITLAELDVEKHHTIKNKLPSFSDSFSCLDLKTQNEILNNLLIEARAILITIPTELQSKSNKLNPPITGCHPKEFSLYSE
ncbi:kynurenine--oxoglutarate transaminase (plasmid) [Legionella adelaidensis]|uniref:Aminotransferase n=1 Tax=Legionella adelaidensis TaxID=45056 RepID=A0A0W0R3S1_9GAMM|nr:pyridoxal phosphate-dependent aminotransferase [Legionella adelaidensis]KTC65687.1 aspartate aminotransferase [Legionella adelaidensis]VEH85969.1 kynurenine--oxoglutarate transaminase [Legionella adelaidensis]